MTIQHAIVRRTGPPPNRERLWNHRTLEGVYRLAGSVGAGPRICRDPVQRISSELVVTPRRDDCLLLFSESPFDSRSESGYLASPSSRCRSRRHSCLPIVPTGSVIAVSRVGRARVDNGSTVQMAREVEARGLRSTHQPVGPGTRRRYFGGTASRPGRSMASEITARLARSIEPTRFTNVTSRASAMSTVSPATRVSPS